MRRFIHANESCHSPGALVFLDTETRTRPHPTKPKATVNPLRLGVAHYLRLEDGKPTRRINCRFNRPDVFHEWLFARLDPRRPTWLWAHNLAFDLTAVRFWDLLLDGALAFYSPDRPRPGQPQAPRSGLVCTDDPPTILEMWGPCGAKLWAVDSLNWLPHKLATLGQWVGWDKLPMPEDGAPEDEWYAYCERDVEILEAAILKCIAWVQQNDLGNFRPTAAGQAMGAWRHRLNPWHPEAPRLVLDDNQEVRDLERAAYVGSRCTCYFIGRVHPEGTDWLEWRHGHPPCSDNDFQGPVWALDLTGAFPSVMVGNKFPTQLVGLKRDLDPDEALSLHPAFGLIGDVEVKTRDEPYPVPIKGETRWRVGHFRTVLCGPELIRAIHSGHVKHVYRLATYALDYLFNRYVEALWRLRKRADYEGDQVGWKLAKTLLVALHGKFGQRSPRWQLWPGKIPIQDWGYFPAPHPTGRETVRWRAVAGSGWTELPPGESAYSFPAVSAFVCSYHRERMRYLVCLCGPRGVYYEDADTLHVTNKAAQLLAQAGETGEGDLGKFRLLGTHEEAIYRGPKWYVLDGQETCGARPKHARLTPGGTWEHQEFARLEQLIASGPEAGPVIATVEKQPPVAHPDRKIGYDGWTQPIEA